MPDRHQLVLIFLGYLSLNPYSSAKAVCVARNWPAHTQELGHPVPEQPVFFMKPSAAFCSLLEPVVLPPWSQLVHHEVELALLIHNSLKDVSIEQAQAGVSHCALSLDLTARDVQNQLKSSGLPWEKAKAFDGSLPIGPWIPIDQVGPLEKVQLQLSLNGQLRQSGYLHQMIHSPYQLLSEASRYFTLFPGDVLLCGTPAGVGPLKAGDHLELSLNQSWVYSTEVIDG